MKIEELTNHLPNPLPESNHPDLLVFIINQSLEETRDIFQARLEKAQKIKHLTTRKKVNDRLYSLKTYFSEPNAPDPVQHICFSLNNSELQIFPLSRKQVALLRDFNLPDFIDYTDQIVPLEKLKTLFSQDQLLHSLQLKNYQLTYQVLDQTKSKTLVTQNISSTTFKEDLNTIIKKYAPPTQSSKPFYVLHGSSTLLKKITPDGTIQVVQTSYQTPQDLLLLRSKTLMSKIHYDLEQFLKLLHHPTEVNKIIYGALEREIKEAIEQYKLKKIWIHQAVYPNFQQLIRLEDLQENLNFEVVLVETLDQGDIAETLRKDYGGIIGQAYY